MNLEMEEFRAARRVEDISMQKIGLSFRDEEIVPIDYISLTNPHSYREKKLTVKQRKDSIEVDVTNICEVPTSLTAIKPSNLSNADKMRMVQK